MSHIDRHANADLHARFEDVHGQYSRIRENVEQLQQDLTAMEVTVKSPDGMVTVVVGVRGSLKQLTLHERAYLEHPPERLAMLITKAAQHAESLISQAVQERLSHLIPGGIGMDQMLRRHDERMGYSNDEQ